MPRRPASADRRSADRLREREQRAVPSWGVDLRRMTLCALGVVVLCTLLLLLASTGLLHAKPFGRHVIAADGAWAGILAGIGGLMWAFMQISTKRPDQGYRHRGLAGLLALGVLIATAINLAAMSVWPLIVGDRAAPDEVIATLLTNPLSLALVASFVLAMHACSASCVLGFIRGGWKSSVALVLPFLAFVLLGVWRGATMFGRPPTVPSVLVWAMIAGLGLGLLAVVAALVGPDRSARRHPTP